MKLKKGFLALFILCVTMTAIKAQIGLGVAYGVDIYQRQSNPQLTDTIKYGQGSALLNFVIGPKLFLGFDKFSLALQGQVGLSPFSFDLNEYKGLGAFYFPVMVSLNYGGISGFQKTGGFGFGIAAGTQFTLTDLYFRKADFDNQERLVFQTYFGQVQFGVGSQAKSALLYLRYGEGDDKASSFHLGVSFELNLTEIGKQKRIALSNEK